ncbi:guanine nucleotide exchange factor MSS4 [Pyrgilauda ruficollis]|uniref:guanine nucleotide exchange factor MSS4 n=1 Tax=Onychostruthus taczanowskii TaxID=356909 RepID=UPI001B805BD2|nr:guanine nucleotide exchange factor MSS4 [Onychostruthus taczanowskii]XP_041345552.1 guanine nucleotide exchange factor MSS4 [Pyrgilauda ruficollis]
MAAPCAEMEPAAPPASPPAPPAVAPGSAGLVCAQGRNLRAVLCQRCGSRVLLPGAATFARRELLLPAMRKKAAAAAAGGGGDVLREHWLVRDMFSFENVGFTRDVGNVKFLVCADCEAGPIGWHCLDDKDSFYVALERVAHE